MATATDIINDALTECGAQTYGQTASTERLAYALARLNRLMEAWGGQRPMVGGYTNQVFTIGATQNSYTWGPGGDLNAARPQAEPDRCNVLLTGSGVVSRYPVQILTAQDWMDQWVKYIGPIDIPNRVYLDDGSPNRTVYFMPNPTPGVQVEFLFPSAMETFSSLADTLDGPAGYREAITTVLAVGLCPGTGRPVTPDLLTAKMEALGFLQNLNAKAIPMRSDAPGSAQGRVWNYRTGNLD